MYVYLYVYVGICLYINECIYLWKFIFMNVCIYECKKSLKQNICKKDETWKPSICTFECDK